MKAGNKRQALGSTTGERLARNLKAWRAKAQKTQRDVAVALGMSERNYIRMEQTFVTPKLETIFQLVRITGRTFEELVR